MAIDLTPYHRALGKTGIPVSPLGLGTVKFGRNEKVKYPQAFALPDEAALAELLALAKSLGINLLDTAPAYGISEERLGRLLAGQRRDWVIVGKAGEAFVDGASHYDFSPAAIQRQVEHSLRQLQTDYLDVLLLHADRQHDEAICRDDALLKCLLDLRAQGMVRAIGTSAVTLAAAEAGAAVFDVLMLAYSLEPTADEAAALATATQHGCGVLLKKVFQSGHAVQDQATKVTQTFAHLFAQPGVHAAIVGTINPQHLLQNVTAAVQSLELLTQGSR